jgi:hypothetical protein
MPRAGEREAHWTHARFSGMPFMPPGQLLPLQLWIIGQFVKSCA